MNGVKRRRATHKMEMSREVGSVLGPQVAGPDSIRGGRLLSAGGKRRIDGWRKARDAASTRISATLRVTFAVVSLFHQLRRLLLVSAAP